MPSEKKPAARKAAPRKPKRATGKPATGSTRLTSVTAPGPGKAAAAEAPAPARSAEKLTGAKTITIEQYASGIGCIGRHRRVLKSLGLRHPRHRVVRPDNPAVRGMVKTIPYLVRILET